MTSFVFAAVLLAAAGNPPAGSTPLTLSTVLDRVSQANPAIAEAAARSTASDSRARAARRLPDLEAVLQQWNAPAARPWRLDEADTIMYGLRQTIPLPPKLSLRGKASAGLTAAAREDRRRVENEQRAQARRAFFEYWRATRELRVHLEHGELSAQIVESAESQYAAGNGRQSDVLRARLELARLHTDVENIQQEILSAQATLRALMDVDSSTPLGEPEAGTPSQAPPPLADLEQRLPGARPEILASRAQSASFEASRRLAREEAFIPDLMIQADYWQNRHERAGTDAMLSISLPFFSRARRDASRAATADLGAARAEERATLNNSLAQLRDAYARATTSQRVLGLYERDIVPLAQHSEESTRSAYAGGNGGLIDLLDSTRSLLDAKLATDRARVNYENAVGDLELALGQPLSNGESR